MTSPYCEECLMRHDACPQCGAAIVANLRMHINMNAHGSGKHWCGAENPGYQAMVRAMREDFEGSREMLSDCPSCDLECVRLANSPVLYDTDGYYGLLGDSAVHQCTPVPVEPVSAGPARQEPVAIVAAPNRPWRIIP